MYKENKVHLLDIKWNSFQTLNLPTYLNRVTTKVSQINVSSLTVNINYTQNRKMLGNLRVN